MKKILLFATLLALATMACKTSGSNLPTDREFALTELNGTAPTPADAKATLLFAAADKRYGGNNACNNYSGTYQLDGATLRLGPAMSTKKYCAETASVEAAFNEMLGKVDGFRYADGKLTLLAGAQVLAVFQ
jgi:heat shock protein HslJ